MEFIRKNKKSILEILFLVLLVVFTFYALLKDQELGEINQVLKTASPGWLIAALVLVIVFVCSESVIIHYMMISLGKEDEASSVYPLQLHRLFLQLHHPFRLRRSAGADLLYE